jgi:predicted HTH domain antitoxin
MEHVTVELGLSRDLLGTLQVTGQELEPELKLLIALEPFREETISCGKAAKVAGQVEAVRELLGDS